ncbi:MAG: hypothetical protein ASARMPRED_005922 [Alectoria sarmentosa]|nr:MAG: hypothetical protein ASARMPRED_005922 [Alectoria sarmentosa]
MEHINAITSHLKRHGWFEMNFYRVHVIYFVLTIILSSVIMYGSGVNGNSGDAEALFRLRYIDAIFLCASAMTNTGLNTVNLSDITGFQQSILCVLILLGNLTIIANVTIWIRRHFFRKYMNDFIKHSNAAREMVDEIDKEESGFNGNSNSTSGIRRRPRGTQKPQTSTTQHRKSHHEIGHGGLPYPWEWDISRKFASRFAAPADPIQERPHHYLSFQPSFDHKGRFHSLSEHEAEELGGVEYRALGVLMWLLPVYILFWLTLAMVIMVPWSYRDSVANIIRYQQPGNLSPGWWASFLVVSGYGNCGLDLLNQNMIPFQGFYLALIVIGGAKLAGNTFFPTFLRLTIWITTKFVPAHSKLHHSLAFLLHHPRRCFILLFPSINTWYLTAIQLSLHLMLWIFWFLLQIDYPTITSIPPGNRTISGLFQALGVRTAGMYIINMSEIAPALLVLYTGGMYISGLPIIISIRSTNVYEERSLGVEKPDKADDNASESSYIGTHLQQQLASDAWWVFTGFFLICIVERDALSIPSPGFDLYAVFFDTISAFGTVGLSTGVPYDTGRHRGLPMAIDRAVLLPGQELMERLDKEYNHPSHGKHRAEEEEEVRREETGSQAESKKGQDPAQDQEMRDNLHQDPGE